MAKSKFQRERVVRSASIGKKTDDNLHEMMQYFDYKLNTMIEIVINTYYANDYRKLRVGYQGGMDTAKKNDAKNEPEKKKMIDPYYGLNCDQITNELENCGFNQSLRKIYGPLTGVFVYDNQQGVRMLNVVQKTENGGLDSFDLYTYDELLEELFKFNNNKKTND